MIPDRDIYADKHGMITNDPAEFAFQIAVRGCHLDERTARRYGITDMLVSTGEPNAVRRVTGRNASSVQITKAEETEDKPVENTEPQEPAADAEPEPEVSKAKSATTSKEVAAKAARIIRDPDASADAKSVAASALTQSEPDKASKKGEKK